jgi:hypothetical protein
LEHGRIDLFATDDQELLYSPTVSLTVELSGVLIFGKVRDPKFTQNSRGT